MTETNLEIDIIASKVENIDPPTFERSFVKKRDIQSKSLFERKDAPYPFTEDSKSFSTITLGIFCWDSVFCENFSVFAFFSTLKNRTRLKLGLKIMKKIHAIALDYAPCEKKFKKIIS